MPLPGKNAKEIRRWKMLGRKLMCVKRECERERDIPLALGSKEHRQQVSKISFKLSRRGTFLDEEVSPS